MSLRSLSLSSLSAPPTTTTTSTTPTSALFFFQKLIQSHSPQDIKRIQHVEISKLLIVISNGSSSSSSLNMEQYCSQVFNALIKANNNTVDKNSSSSLPSSSPNNNNRQSSTSLDHHHQSNLQQQQQRRDTTIRNVLKELISVQTLLLSSSSSSSSQQQAVKKTNTTTSRCCCCFQLSQSLLLFCFKTLLEPSKSFSMDKRIKALCLLLVQNQFNNNQNNNNNNIENGEIQDQTTRVVVVPSILEQYFSRNDLAEVLVSDVEIVPVVLSLLNMYASEQVMNRHWRETIVRPFVLNAAFSNDQNQQNLSETQLYSLLNIVPFIASVIHRSGNGNGGSHLVDVTTNNVVSSVMTTMASSSSLVSSLVSSDPLIEQMEKVFASWLLRAGTFTEKKKAVFRGGAVSVTELDGSPCSGFFTLLNHTQTFSRRQNVNSILFSVLHTWIRSVHRVEPSLLSMSAQANLSSSLSSSQGMVIGSLQNVPSKLKSSHKKDHLLHRHSYDSLTPPSPILNELHIRAMSPAAHHQTPQDSIAQQQQQRQHMPMNNQLLDAIVQYCLRLIQQSELKYNNSRESVRSLFTSSYIESVLVETVRQLDEICTIYPVVVGRVFPSLKKLFHILCNQRILVQQALLTQQQQQQQQQTQSSTLSPSRRKYQVEKPKLTIKPTKQVPTSEQLLQHSLMTRSNMGCLLICLIEFFIHHIHTLVYDPQPLFQSFFSEQFPYYYREPLFPIELMILFLDNQKIIHYETKLLDDYYPQLFKLMAYSPHQIVEELSVVLPSIISHSNYLDVFHRILDLPMLSFVLDCDSKKLNIQTSDVLNSLFESVVSDNVNALRDFWAKRMLSADWDQMCQQINGILPDVAIQTSECTTKLLETYFSVLLEEEDSEELLHELLPILLKRVNTLTPVHRGTYLQDTRKVLLKYFVVVLERWPAFIVDMKNLLLQTLQEVNDDVFVNVCYSIGQSIAACADARLTTQLIVQYFEALELVTFEQLARARVQKKLSAQRKLADLPSEMEEEFLVSSRYSTQCLNTLISSMVKICGRCPDLVPRVIVCLTNLVKHYDSLHASVVQRANESIRLLRFPSIVTSLFCSAVVTSRNDGK